MARQIILAPGERARQKEAARNLDARRLASGEVSAAQLQSENDFFNGLDFSRARISAIGKRRIIAR